MAIDAQIVAQDIFINWATQAGPSNWQWDDMAQSALNAAARLAAVDAASTPPPIPTVSN